jgi:hypothetical protein
MCIIICDVSYSCGHSEPCTYPRTCQFDFNGYLKSPEEDPLCLFGNHCSELVGGSVRRIHMDDPDMGLCSECFAWDTRQRDHLSVRAIRGVVRASNEEAEWHARRAEEIVAESEAEREWRPRLEDKADLAVYVAEVSDLALERLETVSFGDFQMEDHSFDELLRVILALPAFIDKHALVKAFANYVECRYPGDGVRMEVYHNICIQTVPGHDFGPAFWEGLEHPFARWR